MLPNGHRKRQAIALFLSVFGRLRRGETHAFNHNKAEDIKKRGSIKLLRFKSGSKQGKYIFF